MRSGSAVTTPTTTRRLPSRYRISGLHGQSRLTTAGTPGPLVVSEGHEENRCADVAARLVWFGESLVVAG